MWGDVIISMYFATQLCGRSVIIGYYVSYFKCMIIVKKLWLWECDIFTYIYISVTYQNSYFTLTNFLYFTIWRGENCFFFLLTQIFIIVSMVCGSGIYPQGISFALVWIRSYYYACSIRAYRNGVGIVDFTIAHVRDTDLAMF